jgi:hypothetical protein
MAEVIGRWPATSPDPDRPSKGASHHQARRETTAPPRVAEGDPDGSSPGQLVGRTRRGELFGDLYVAIDAGTGRRLLVERLARALDEEELAILRRLAAAGSPGVQRVLALTPDRAAITYELVEGQEVDVADLTTEESRLLGDDLDALDSARAWLGAEPRIARTPTGPVILLARPLPP